MGNAGNGKLSGQAKITEQFNKFKDAKDSTIKRDKFQEALAVVDSMGSRKLKDSPLADLIFDLFARTNPLSITDKEFSACALALSSINAAERTETTFQALAGFGQDQVSNEAVVELFEKSWRSACKAVIAKRKLRVNAIGGDDFSAMIEKFCEKNMTNISDEVRGSLLKHDKTGKGSLDRSEFVQWSVLDRTVKIVIESDTFEVPTSLTHQRNAAAYPQLNPQ